MRIDNRLLKCVAFVAAKDTDGQYHLRGSAFWTGRRAAKSTPAYGVVLVTAKHVIDRIRQTGCQTIGIRINLIGGNAIWYDTNLSDWYFSDDNTADVAISPLGIEEQWDHYVMPSDLSLEHGHWADYELTLGDSIFAIGLFKHYTGKARAIPIVRVGNVAALGEEKVTTKEIGEMDAYLFEMHSIGGLSGSPVFVHIGNDSKVKASLQDSSLEQSGLLCGLIHGHYDTNEVETDEANPDGISTGRVNTGIAIIVPSTTIWKVINEITERMQ